VRENCRPMDDTEEKGEERVSNSHEKYDRVNAILVLKMKRLVLSRICQRYKVCEA